MGTNAGCTASCGSNRLLDWFLGPVFSPTGPVICPMLRWRVQYSLRIYYVAHVGVRFARALVTGGIRFIVAARFELEGCASESHFLYPLLRLCMVVAPSI